MQKKGSIISHRCPTCRVQIDGTPRKAAGFVPADPADNPKPAVLAET